MKRSPLKRKSPLLRTNASKLSRQTPLKARGSGKYARRPRARSYMGWVAGQPCCLRLAFAAAGLPVPEHKCEGHVQVDHAGDRVHGSFRRSLDAGSISLCVLAHAYRTDYSGPFKGFTGERMQAWRRSAVTLTQARARSQGIAIPTC